MRAQPSGALARAHLKLAASPTRDQLAAVALDDRIAIERMLTALATSPGISPRSGKQTASRARGALRDLGVDLTDGRGRPTLPDSWRPLIAHPNAARATALSVFAHWATRQTLEPSDVRDEVMSAYEASLSSSGRPSHSARQHFRAVVCGWNDVAKTIPALRVVTDAPPPAQSVR